MIRKDTLPVTSLDLDVLNPRAKPEEGQPEEMRSLLTVELEGEKVFKLARDICEVGMLDPGDRMYVMRSAQNGDRYTVLDGNRRLASLLLLSQPEWLDRNDIGLSTAMQQRFKRLQSEFPNRWPSEVDVVIFDDRESANHFIRLRHTGENAGAGRSEWSALQVARFDHTGLWQCIEQLRTENVLNLDVVNELDRSSFAITNFERVAGKAEFQRRFGFSLGKNSFLIGADRLRTIFALSKLASDVTSKRVDTRGEFEKVELMTPYFDEVDAAISAEIEARNKSLVAISASKLSGGSSSQTNQGIQGAPPSDGQALTQPTEFVMKESAQSHMPVVRKERQSKYLIKKTDLLTVTNPKCCEIVDELKRKVEVKAPYACALLLRSLQEMTAELYLSAMKQEVKSNKTTNITQAANHLLGNRHSTDPADFITLAKSFQQSASVYDQLCDTAHSTNTKISSDHVRNTWATVRGGIDLLWKRIAAVPLGSESRE
jgi:hypothetical protein